MELNLSWITPSLAVGGRYPIEAAAHLARELGIRRIVDVRVEDKDDEAVLRAHDVLLLHLPTEDGRAIAQGLIWDGVRWVNEQLDIGARVYIHCEHGVGRSALLALCVLVSRGHEPLGALELTKGARAAVSPSPEQLQAFLDWCAGWREQAVAAWRLPTLEQLMIIAYRHLHQPASP
jgi:predicted protein tyrosine phosphatase